MTEFSILGDKKSIKGTWFRSIAGWSGNLWLLWCYRVVDFHFDNDIRDPTEVVGEILIDQCVWPSAFAAVWLRVIYRWKNVVSTRPWPFKHHRHVMKNHHCSCPFNCLFKRSSVHMHITVWYCFNCGKMQEIWRCVCVFVRQCYSRDLIMPFSQARAVIQHHNRAAVMTSR